MVGRQQVLVLSWLLFYFQLVHGTDSKLPRDEGSNCVDAQSKRTLSNIIWGCVSTTIICAWAAVHPNVPPRESPLKKTLRRLDLMFCTIVAPEILPSWALNQLLAAFVVKGYKQDRFQFWKTFKSLVTLGEIKEAVNKAWTLKHGHFLIMGGFHLIEPVEGIDTSASSTPNRVAEKESTPVAENPDPRSNNADAEKGPPTLPEKKPQYEGGRMTILTLEMLRELIKDPEFEISVTEDDISDRAKGDALSKFIFILQTSWFILQVIARHVQGLDITQLELTTLALASLNAATFILWWHKPLGAQTPVRVYLKRKLTDDERNAGRDPENEALRSQLIPMVRRRLSLRLAAIRKIAFCEPDEGNNSLFIVKLISLPFLVLQLFLAPLFVLVSVFVATFADIVATSSISADATHVSTFYVPEHGHEDWSPPYVLLIILGSIFGGLHCAGWNLPFPSHKEQVLWRAASLTVTGIPVGGSAITFLVVFPSIRAILRVIGIKLGPPDDDIYVPNVVSSIFLIVFTFVYVAARLVLLGQALLLLRNQPPSAFLLVDWLKFYPHIF